MTILECRSCGDRWIPNIDERAADPEPYVELTFCRLCGNQEYEDHEMLWGEPEEGEDE